METEEKALSRVRARVLSPEQAERIVRAALQILEEVGERIESEEALGILKGQGALVKGDVVRIPRDLVDTCLGSVARKVVIHGRDGAASLRLGEGNTYYAPGMTCPNVLDPLTGERRPFGRNDTRVVGLLADALPNVDYVIGGGIIEDVTPALAAAYEFAELAACTNKPLFGWAHDEVILGDIYQMACAIAGGEGAFQEKPNCLIFINPVSPLVMSPEVAGRVMFAARKGIPIIVWPYVLAGGTTPVTVAGGLATTLAEMLGALVLQQSLRPGAPFIFGSSLCGLDMKRGVAAEGPSTIVGFIALADILEHLGVISYLAAASNTSKTLDQQAVLEASCACMGASLAGPDLIAGMGALDEGMTMSPGLMVIADDMVAISRRARQGMEVSEEALALDAVRRVGPGGHFLADEHTLNHFRDVMWEPSLLDREKFEDWDGRTLEERVNERVRDILSSHNPKPLPDKVQASIDDILNRAEARQAKANG